MLPKVGEELCPVGAGLVHLVYEEEGRHMVAGEKLPECFGMSLDAVGTADDKHCVVKNRECLLHLGGKVNVARGVEEISFYIKKREGRHL